MPAPIGNTGVETPKRQLLGQSVGLGWLKGTVHDAHPEVLAGWLARRLGYRNVVARPGVVQWYRKGVRIGDRGSVLGWDPRSKSSKSDECLVSVVQSDLDRLGFGASHELGVALLDRGMRFSRVDVFVDDWEHVIEPSELYRLWRAGQVCSHVRNIELQDGTADGRVGSTVKVGSRSSSYYLRVYLRGGVTGDCSDPVRWELELKDDGASVVGSELVRLGYPGELRRAAWANIAGLADWRDVGEGQRAERAFRSHWFGYLTSDALAAGSRVSVSPSSLDRRRNWLASMVSRTLALVVLADGDRVLDELVSDGLGRLTAEGVAQVGEARGMDAVEVRALARMWRRTITECDQG